MSTLWIVVIGVLTTYLAYNFYAKRIDRDVIRSDPKRVTPARMRASSSRTPSSRRSTS